MPDTFERLRAALSDRYAIEPEPGGAAQEFRRARRAMSKCTLNREKVLQLCLACLVCASLSCSPDQAALFRAAEHGDTDKLTALLDEGTNPEVKKANGWTPLVYAAINGHTDIVNLLLDRGANPEVKDGHHETPLMLAAHMGRTEVVKVLLGRGADVSKRNFRRRRTALMFASERGHTEVVKALLGRGADLNARDANGLTALMWARAGGDTV